MSRKDRFDDGLKSISVGNPVLGLSDAIVGTYYGSGGGSGVDVCNNNNNNNNNNNGGGGCCCCCCCCCCCGGGTGFLIEESEMVL